MKKLLSMAIVTAVSVPVFADTTVGLSHESNKETTANVGYALENGLSFDVELVGQDNFKNLKETTLGAAWKFDISSNLYVQPQVAFTMPVHNNSQSALLIIDNETIKGKLKVGNTAKFGLKTGYNFDNGLYLSGRYRYEMATDTLKLTEFDNNNKPTGNRIKVEFDKNVHRTDVTFGYSMEMVDISTNWVHKELKNKGSLILDIQKKSSRIDYYEFKATVNAFGDIKPYVQYTLDQTEVVFGNQKLKADNLFKVGVNYTF